MSSLKNLQRTKIVATLGPSSEKVEDLVRLIEAGVNVVRLNFSHGSYDEHLQRLTNVREAQKIAQKPVGILQDLCGPKIRCGIMAGAGLELKPGATVTIVADDKVIGENGRFGTTYAEIAKDVKPGDRILLNDGVFELQCEKVRGQEVTCTVIRGGLLKSKKGINLPGVSISTPSVTAKDLADLKWGLEHGIDYVALSFVRSPTDIQMVRQRMTQVNYRPLVIAKIERPEGVDRIDAILDVADGIMVARGDLGVELSPEAVPVIQKRLIQKANDLNKPVITATQMLESMISAARPTRAEVSDIANAILDGTDAIMLSGETAVGQYPVEAVEVMHSVACRIEAHMFQTHHERAAARGRVTDALDAICLATGLLANEAKVKCVVATSTSGKTANMMSKARPRVPIVGMSPDPKVHGRMALFWGVYSTESKPFHDRRAMIEAAEEVAQKLHFAERGDWIVILSGTPFGVSGHTNDIHLHRIGEIQSGVTMVMPRATPIGTGR